MSLFVVDKVGGICYMYSLCIVITVKFYLTLYGALEFVINTITIELLPTPSLPPSFPPSYFDSLSSFISFSPPPPPPYLLSTDQGSRSSQ